VEIKCQLDATDVFFFADLISCSTCFGAPLCPSSGAPGDGHNGAPRHVEQAIRSAIKKHLLHLVGILFAQINDDARSKSLQMQVTLYIFRATVLFICWLVLWNVSILKWCSFYANLTILSQVETNAAHIICLLEYGL
jgi:hypothetical protein